MDEERESAKAASPSRGDAEIVVLLFQVLGGNVLHDDFIGNVPGGGCKIPPTPYVTAPKLSVYFLYSERSLYVVLPLRDCVSLEKERQGGTNTKR